jgi:transglutaminase-like putative cysteine protease
MPIINNMLVRKYLLAACFLLCLHTVSPARPETVELTGGMSSTTKFQDNITITVPPAIENLTVTIPIPTNRKLFGYSQTLSNVRVVSSRPPDATKSITDQDGNTYTVEQFAHPAPGTIGFTILADSATIAVDLAKPLPTCPAQLTNLPPDVTGYLKSTAKVQSDDPLIISIAHELLTGAPDEATLTARIQEWVQHTVTYDTSGQSTPDDALYVLTHKSAICDGWAHLFLALARADGLPARFVGGYSLGGDITYPLDTHGNSIIRISCAKMPHSWVEVWFPESGWVPFEPQASAGFVDSHHLAVWVGDDSASVASLLSWTTYQTTRCGIPLTEVEGAAGVSDRINLSCFNTDTAGYGTVTTLVRRSQ